MAQGIKKINENVISKGRALTLTNATVLDNGLFEVGTLRCNPISKGLEFKIGEDMFSKFDAYEALLDGTVIESLLATDSVTTMKIKDLNVTTDKIANKNVTTSKLDDYAVTEIKIAPNAVTTSKIKDLNITTEKINDRSVTNIKIGLNEVYENNINTQAVSTRTIALAAVTSDKIATNAVLSRHILNQNVTHEKYAIGSIYGNVIPDQAIITNHLKNDSVTTVKIANGSITSSKIGSGQVLENNLGVGSVTNQKLAASSVTSSKIASSSIQNSHIQSGTITLGKLTPSLQDEITSAIKYDSYNNVTLKKNLTVSGRITALGDIEGARVLNAIYMDLAEAYIPGEKLEEGDIVEIRTDGKVYKAKALSTSVVGVVSNHYAACYGATQKELDEGTKIAIGLIGKVPVKVNGPITIGQKVLVSNSGIGQATSNSTTGIVGKALQTVSTKGINKVLCLIYPS